MEYSVYIHIILRLNGNIGSIIVIDGKGTQSCILKEGKEATSIQVHRWCDVRNSDDVKVDTCKTHLRNDDDDAKQEMESNDDVLEYIDDVTEIVEVYQNEPNLKKIDTIKTHHR